MTNLQSLFIGHEHYLDQLADHWLAQGAQQLRVVSPNDEVLFAYPNHSIQNGTTPTLTNIHVSATQANKPLFVLHVDLLSPMIKDEVDAYCERLQYDANALLRMIRLENELEAMTVELVETQDQMLALYQLARSVRGELDLNTIIDVLVQEAIHILNVEAVCILLSTQHPMLILTHPHPMISDSALRKHFKEIRRTKREISGAQLQGSGGQAKNGIIVPLYAREKIVGCFGFFNRDDSFNAPSLKLARAIAEEASVQIEKSLLYQNTLSQARMRAELDVAANIQTQLLPQTIPDVENVDLYAASIQAKQVGGDFYDFTYKEGIPLTISVGDVAGKGMSAALLMAMTRTVLRTWIKTLATNQAAPVLAMVNDDLYDDYTQVNSFTTVFVGRYLPESGILRYANAGHSPVIHYTPEVGATLMKAEDMPLGILPDIAFTDQEIKLQSGDILVVATDGFSEATDPDDNMFGYDQLEKAIEKHAHEPAQVIARTLFDTVDMFSAGTEQSDDMTLLVLKIL